MEKREEEKHILYAEGVERERIMCLRWYVPHAGMGEVRREESTSGQGKCENCRLKTAE